MDTQNSQRARGRRRRENVVGGRSHSHRVVVSPEEEAVLVRMAAEQQVTVPRLLMEAALNGGHEMAAERRRVITELFAVRRQLGEITLGLRALIESGGLTDAVAGAAAEQIERNRDLAERLMATAQGLAAP